jgi:hypothetical protein
VAGELEAVVDSGTSRAPRNCAWEKEEGELRMGWSGGSGMAAVRGSPPKAGHGGGARGFGPATSGAASDSRAVGPARVLYLVQWRQASPTSANWGVASGDTDTDKQSPHVSSFFLNFY